MKNWNTNCLLNKSKIERAAAAIKSYKSENAENNINSDNSTRDSTERDVAGTGSLWSYRNKPAKNDSSVNSDSNSVKTKIKPDKRSPIKIPVEEEQDAEFYEAFGDEGDASDASDRASISRKKIVIKLQLICRSFFTIIVTH